MAGKDSTGIQIDISHNLESAYQALGQISKVEVHRAAKRSINSTLVTLRKDAVPIIQQEIRVKSSLLKSFILIDRAQSSSKSQISGALQFRSKGFPLIDFVRGSKKVTEQKGIKVKRRKAVKVEIKPGAKFTVRGGFIANTGSRGLQIFKRRNGERKNIYMQTTPSLGQLLLKSTKNKIGSQLQQRGAALFQERFAKDLQFRMSDAFKKAKAERQQKISKSSRAMYSQL